MFLGRLRGSVATATAASQRTTQNLQRLLVSNYGTMFKNENDGTYESVPHYKQNSALVISQPDKSPFPNLISPDVNFDPLFLCQDMQKSSLNVNLTARYSRLDLDKLKSDYLKMRSMEERIESLQKEKEVVSEEVKKLIKEKGGNLNKKATLQSYEVKVLLDKGNRIRAEIHKISEELAPIKSIVNTACLRLPNNLHYSTLFIHNYLQGKSHELLSPSEAAEGSIFKKQTDTEDSSKLVIFEINESPAQNHRKSISGDLDWRNVLDDSVVIDSRLVRNSYAKNLTESWSFVEKVNSDLISFYATGTYAKLHQALVDYVQDKLSKLDYEHVKSVGLFKSAIVEGCGQAFYDPSNTFNIVRFSSKSHRDSKKAKQQQPDGSNIELLHLTGSSSLQALVLQFVRTTIESQHLPWTIYTHGNNYIPRKGQLSTYELLVQCDQKSSYLLEDHLPSEKFTETHLHSMLESGKSYLDQIKRQLTEFKSNPDLAHLRHDGKSIDQIFISLCQLFVYIYKDFNLPVRFVCVDANQLKQSESFKIEIQAYLPSKGNYFKVEP